MLDTEKNSVFLNFAKIRMGWGGGLRSATGVPFVSTYPVFFCITLSAGGGVDEGGGRSRAEGRHRFATGFYSVSLRCRVTPVIGFLVYPYQYLGDGGWGGECSDLLLVSQPFHFFVELSQLSQFVVHICM